jgi:hypothetical protein
MAPVLAEYESIRLSCETFGDRLWCFGEPPQGDGEVGEIPDR